MLYVPAQTQGGWSRVLQTAYDGYAQGEYLYPSLEITEGISADDFPRKARHAANLLIGAWDIIRYDEANFAATAELIRDDEYATAIVGIGRNATKVAVKTPRSSELVIDEHFTDVVYAQLNQLGIIGSNGEIPRFIDNRIIEVNSGFEVLEIHDQVVFDPDQRAALLQLG